MDGAVLEVTLCGDLRPDQVDLTGVFFAFLQGQLRALATTEAEHG